MTSTSFNTCLLFQLTDNSLSGVAMLAPKDSNNLDTDLFLKEKTRDDKKIITRKTNESCFTFQGTPIVKHNCNHEVHISRDHHIKELD